MTRRVVDLWSPAIGASGTVIVYGHWGRPVLVFPSEEGRAVRLRDQRDGRRGRRPAGRRPGQALLRRQLRRRTPGRTAASRSRSAPAGTAPTSRGSSTRSSPFIHDDCGGPREIAHHRRAAWAPTTPRTSPCGAPTCSRWRCACPATTTRRTWHGWGEQGDALYFQNPIALRRRAWTATTWTGCAAGVRCCWSCGQGMWEDTTGSLASTRAFAGAAGGEGHPARAGRLGVRRRARLAVVAAPAGPPPAPVLLSAGGRR